MKLLQIFAICALLFALLARTEAAAHRRISNSVLTDGDQDLELWEKYKTKFKKLYAPQEENSRREIWEENVRYIQKHNLEHDLGMHSFRLRVNEYADLTDHERSKYLLGTRVGNDTKRYGMPYTYDNSKPLPKTVDWKKKGYVTSVKDQGRCGSCWAFAATGALEGQHFKAQHKLVSLSEQNLMDCSTEFGNKGCGGGLVDLAFLYVAANRGLDTESFYPYLGKDGTCRFNKSEVGTTCRGFYDVTQNDEAALKSATALIGPISVAIDASSKGFAFYHSGVMDDPKCSSAFVNHGVLVVGYGTWKGKEYWLVKNSWGTSWGDKGYIKMSRNKNNQCAIASHGSFPFV